MDLGIEGRAAVVTGASRGIGLATARALEAEGVRVLEANGPSAEILLTRLRQPRVAPDEIEVSPEMIQRWTSASKDEQLS